MNESSQKPNFFIIGGPKCGTSSLSEYLRTHSQIFFSDPKELSFFNHDMVSGPRSPKTMDDYLSYFAGVENEKAIGEGTPFYLYSEVAVPNILDFNPESKFIVMVRNPISMAYSLHSQNLFNLLEDIDDFQEAWQAQWDASKRSAKKALKPLQYGPVCKLGEQIDRLYNFVPEDKVHVIVFDDFVENTQLEYKKTLEFLGLKFDGRQQFPAVNQHKQNKSRRIRRFTQFISRHIYRPIEPVSEYVKNKLGIQNWGLFSQFIWRLGTDYSSERQPLSPEFKQELKEYFREDVELLSSLLNRDLTNWLEH